MRGAELALCLLAATGAAQRRPLARSETSLDGLWQLRAGQAAWRDAWVPAAFETVLGTDFDGVAEYRYRLRLEPRPGERLFVRFAAVATHARVFLGGVELGTHLGGWTPFRFELPARAFASGPQELRVIVDERVGHPTQGFLPDIAPHYGGIWQSVTLQRYTGPAFDPDRVELRTALRGERGTLHAGFAAQEGCTVALRLRHRSRVVAERSFEARGSVELDATVVPWSPARPEVYEAEIDLVRDGRVLDRITRPVAFVEIGADGRRVLVNGKAFRMRGVLHWGFEPPRLAPNPPESVWRGEMRWAKRCGFNTIKACLWLPPPSFFRVALEEGLMVWQEYPAWHPDFSAKQREPLLREYGEFFRADRRWPHVIARSLTCETGRAAADAGVVKALYEACKAATGGVLVEDDSSWITWNRFHDFYDDHPYGNPGDWVGRLRGFDRYIEQNGAKPLLLGEAIAGDTWVDLAALDALLAGREPWWKPYALDSMRTFDARHGGARLVAESKAYALALRKYEIESLRRVLPHAGYVSSVMRDFMRARMGFFDDAGRPKWGARDFAWHGDRMLVLDDPRPIRSIPAAAAAAFAPQLRGAGKVAVTAQRHGMRIVVSARARGCRPNRWTFWALPDIDDAVPPGVRIERDVTPELLDWVARGGRLLLLAGGKGGPVSQGLWWLRGAPFGPARHALFARVPRETLIDLQPFDLDGPVFRMTELTQRFGLVLGFWDSHDQRQHVATYGLLLEAKLGEGRIIACSLGLDPKREPRFGGCAPDGPNPARAWLRRELARWLERGPAPRARLDAAAVAMWKAAIRSRKVELGGVWRLQPDLEDAGVKQGWMKPGFDDSKWIASRTGSHWEAAGLPHYDGVAWYRKTFETPAGWRPGQPLFAIFDGVDDSYVLWVNGKRAAAFGDPKTGETVWLIKTSKDIGPLVKPGRNLLALRVVDHQGAGGLHRKVWLGSEAPGVEDLVNR